MQALWNQPLFTLESMSLTLGQLILLGLLLVASLVVLRLARRSLAGMENRRLLSSELRKQAAVLIRLFVLLVVLLAGFRILGFNLKELMEYELVNVPPVRIALYHILLVVLAILIVKFIMLGFRRIFDRMVKRQSMDVGVSMAIFQIVKYSIWVIALLFVLDSVGIKITILLAGAGALLIGIGFGVQQIFSDIISGFILLFERNIKVNDVVELDGVVGQVKDIGLRTSRIVTRDNIEILVPNTHFISDNVINWSHLEDATRFHIDVGVAYGSDVRLVEKVLLNCAREHPDVLQDKEPLVFFKDFGNSSLDFQLLFWTHKAFLYEKIRSDIRFSIDAAFREHGIQIPFPQRDVHIKTNTGAKS